MKLKRILLLSKLPQNRLIASEHNSDIIGPSLVGRSAHIAEVI